MKLHKNRWNHYAYKKQQHPVKQNPIHCFEIESKQQRETGNRKDGWPRKDPQRIAQTGGQESHPRGRGLACDTVEIRKREVFRDDHPEFRKISKPGSYDSGS